MKTVIFLLFSFISYVFAGTPGPLGLAAKMPPYRPFDGETQLKNDTDFSHSLEDALFFLSRGSGDNCLQHLSHACNDLKRTYNESSPGFGFILSIVCDGKQTACSKLVTIQHELCNVGEVTYEDVIKKGPLNSDICFELYTKCRLRSSGCSSEYRTQCRRLMSMCHRSYNLHDFYTVFLEGAGTDVGSPGFDEKLADLCRSLFNISDVFVQLCLDPDSLKRDLGNFIKLQEQGQGNFYSYPEVSSGALLKAQGQDGGLFSPRTQSGTDPLYLLGYLLSRSGSTSLIDACTRVTKECMGLGFFPQTAPFCEINSHQTLSSTNCQQVETDLKQTASDFKLDLEQRLSNNDLRKASGRGGVNADLCARYLVNCSYLKGLDSGLSYLCDLLEDYCSYSLEIAASLSLFEYMVRDYYKGKNSGYKLHTCEKDLDEICNSTKESDTDFLLFCYKPGHTCTALRSLVSLRCEEYKKRFDVDTYVERSCVDLAFEYAPYVDECPHYENFLKFFAGCYAEFPENVYLKELLATTLKGLIDLKKGDSETQD